MMSSNSSFLSHIKENLPKHFGVFMAVLMAAFSLASSYASKNTHVEDVQKDQERRLVILEQESANRRELDEVKKTVDRIENKLDKLRDEELRFHRQ